MASEIVWLKFTAFCIALLLISLVVSCDRERSMSERMADKGFCYAPVTGSGNHQWQRCK